MVNRFFISYLGIFGFFASQCCFNHKYFAFSYLIITNISKYDIEIYKYFHIKKWLNKKILHDRSRSEGQANLHANSPKSWHPRVLVPDPLALELS